MVLILRWYSLSAWGVLHGLSLFPSVPRVKLWKEFLMPSSSRVLRGLA